MEMLESKPTRRDRSGKCIYAVALIMGLGASASAPAEDRYQYRMLLNPSAEMLAAERRGYIMIYDGLENGVVERALTEQYDRIENMMFVGTRYLQEGGDLLYEEDGCD